MEKNDDKPLETALANANNTLDNLDDKLAVQVSDLFGAQISSLSCFSTNLLGFHGKLLGPLGVGLAMLIDPQSPWSPWLKHNMKHNMLNNEVWRMITGGTPLKKETSSHDSIEYLWAFLTASWCWKAASFVEKKMPLEKHVRFWACLALLLGAAQHRNDVSLVDPVPGVAPATPQASAREHLCNWTRKSDHIPPPSNWTRGEKGKIFQRMEVNVWIL